MRPFALWNASDLHKRGSHVVMKKGEAGCVIPRHPVLAIGTLRGALKRARVTVEEFLQGLG
jgi:predicted RNA binding protein YcfA (HicA-like mRNA interferase family)